MILCADAECALCSLIPGFSGCLRKQALRYMRLSEGCRIGHARGALEELSLILMDGACALENALAIPPAA